MRCCWTDVWPVLTFLMLPLKGEVQRFDGLVPSTAVSAPDRVRQGAVAHHPCHILNQREDTLSVEASTLVCKHPFKARRRKACMPRKALSGSGSNLSVFTVDRSVEVT